jgi:DNA topoisomerase VI subunit B
LGLSLVAAIFGFLPHPHGNRPGQVGVFVSIVSTKIPFKGAGKEYIGDDIEEMVAAVKHAIQACGLQVRRIWPP